MTQKLRSFLQSCSGRSPGDFPNRISPHFHSTLECPCCVVTLVAEWSCLDHRGGSNPCFPLSDALSLALTGVGPLCYHGFLVSGMFLRCVFPKYTWQIIYFWIFPRPGSQYGVPKLLTLYLINAYIIVLHVELYLSGAFVMRTGCQCYTQWVCSSPHSPWRV